MQDLLKQHLSRARQIMKDQADRHRSDRQFAVGDWVFLKVQPYVQNSVADRASHKLAFRYFGPFRVEARVGEVSYKLLLPEKTLIHPVVHVSLLRRAQPPSELEQVRLPPPPPSGDATHHDDVPGCIFQRQQYLRGSTVRLKCWCSGHPCRLCWQPGKTKLSYGLVSLTLRLGVKPALKEGRMSRLCRADTAATLPRPPRQATCQRPRQRPGHAGPTACASLAGCWIPTSGSLTSCHHG